MKLLLTLEHYSTISNIPLINSLCCYILIIVCWEAVALLVNILFMLIKRGVITVLAQIAKNTFGIKTINYKWYVLGYMKLYSDLLCVLRYMYIPQKIRLSFDIDKSPSALIKTFSLDNLLYSVHCTIAKLFAASPVNVLAFVLAVNIYFRDYIASYLNKLLSAHISLEDGVSMTNICLFSFIILFSLTDVIHKIDAYSSVRKKHYEKVIKNEGRLLEVLVKIRVALNRNIDFIIQRKGMILQSGAWDLCRKSFLCENGQLELMDTEYLAFRGNSAIDGFVELESEFDELTTIVNKLNSFGVSYSNLFHNYDNDFRLRYFIDEASQKRFGDIEKHRCFSKSDMSQWYTNWFLRDRDKHYSDKQLVDHLREASLVLDYMLLESMERELEYQHCIRRLENKFTKLNKYSRIKLK